MRVKASESVFATATGHHRDMVYVGIVDHRRECGVSVASGELMPGVLFPKLNEILFLHRRNYGLWCCRSCSPKRAAQVLQNLDYAQNPSMSAIGSFRQLKKLTLISVAKRTSHLPF